GLQHGLYDPRQCAEPCHLRRRVDREPHQRCYYPDRHASLQHCLRERDRPWHHLDLRRHDVHRQRVGCALLGRRRRHHSTERRGCELPPRQRRRQHQLARTVSMSPYDPSKWYWIVASDTTRVWSSAAATYVPATDAGYTAWLAEGNMATHIVSEAELQEVLAQQYPAGWPPNPVQVAFAGPLAVTCTSIPALNGNYA